MIFRGEKNLVIREKNYKLTSFTLLFLSLFFTLTISCGDTISDLTVDVDVEADLDIVEKVDLDVVETVDVDAVSDSLGFCAAKCTTVSDCTSMDAVLMGEDNYECSNGFCKYLGCVKDEECAEEYGSAYIRCNQDSGEFVAQCTTPCSKPADCVGENVPLFLDEDNWECPETGLSAGLCRYKGCVSHDECGDRGCYEDSRLPTPHCLYGCETNQDCTNLGELYICEEEHCVDRCKTNEDCQSAFGSSKYGCDKN